MTNSIKHELPHNGKIPPQAIETEAQVLGCMITFPEAISHLLNILKPYHFYREEHQKIYEVIIELYKKDYIPDLIMIVNILRDKNILEEIGGAHYIASLTSINLSFRTTILKSALYLVEKYTLREIIKVNAEAMNRSYNNEDPFMIISEINSKFTFLVEQTRAMQQKDFSKNISTIIDTITNIHTNDEAFKKSWLPFGIPALDRYALVAPNNTLLIGGKSGSGKTRTVIKLMRELLKHHYDKVSVKWYSMEDDAPKLVRCFLSPLVNLTDEQMEGKNYRLTELDIHNLNTYKDVFSKYDIDIVEEPRSMADINIEFKAFVTKRPNKFCILIIDNLMLLNDNNSKEQQNKIDDRIARELYSIRNSCHNNHINAYTIVVHHFTDEQLDAINLKSGYRPREKHLKGSTRIRDAATQIILLNRFANYPDLLEIYPDQKDIINKLTAGEITKNRNGGTGIFRAFTELPYTDYHFIDE